MVLIRCGLINRNKSKNLGPILVIALIDRDGYKIRPYEYEVGYNLSDCF